MNTLVFATNNNNKIREAYRILGSEFNILSLDDIKCNNIVEENGNSFSENARIKALNVYLKHKINVFADDSGLEVKSLGGKPGVHSARYSVESNSSENIKLLLNNMHGITDRRARFITVICLIFSDKEYLFHGKVNGIITNEIEGAEGFGYDPVFRPDGLKKTFGQMSMEDKNLISHRSAALSKLAKFIKET